jgi:hypothetical protein
MKSKNVAPVAGTKGFAMAVMPERKYLDKAIENQGFCNPSKCWHKVAIASIVDAWGPVNSPHIRVDAGHVKLNYRGWRYIADTPLHVKRSLMLFDKKRYDEVHIREYTLRFRRTTKVIRVSRERQDAINASRSARIRAGSNERKKYSGPTMRDRVVGHSSVV